MKKFHKYFLIIVVSLIIIYLSDKYLPKLFSENLPKSNKIVVLKSERKLLLFKDSSLIRTYNVSLGKNPIGDKEKEGDSKTPEGKYFIDWRNKNSKFHLSLHISYPNKKDLNESKEKGLNPGGNIMIHGRPNLIGWLPFIYENKDWTDGCIAVSNIEIEEIWKSIKDNSEVIIKP